MHPHLHYNPTFHPNHHTLHYGLTLCPQVVGSLVPNDLSTVDFGNQPTFNQRIKYKNKLNLSP
jgi:hypothetical protein